MLDEEAARREAELREQEALERGREEGWKEGRKEGILATPKRMLQKGLDVEMVAKITEHSIKQVQAIRDEIDQ